MLRTQLLIMIGVLGFAPLHAHKALEGTGRQGVPVARSQAPRSILHEKAQKDEKSTAAQSEPVTKKVTARQAKRAQALEKKALCAEKKQQKSTKKVSLFSRTMSRIVKFFSFKKKDTSKTAITAKANKHQKNRNQPLSLAQKVAAHSGSEPYVINWALLSEQERTAYLKELASPGASHITYGPYSVVTCRSLTQDFKDANGQMRVIQIMSRPAHAVEDQVFTLEWSFLRER